MSPRASCVLMGALLVVFGTTTVAPAALFSYSQTFQTTGVQATDSGDTFDDYPEWNYYESSAEASSAKVDTAGTLTLNVSGAGVGKRLAGYVTAQYLTGQASFDVSTTALTVSADIGGDGTRPGWYAPGLQIGSLRVLFFPGYSGLVYITDTSGTLLYSNVLGFTPTPGTKYPFSVSIVEDASHLNYLLSYSIGTYTGSLTEPKSGNSVISDVRLFFEGENGSNGYYSNFTVMQVPEPGALVLLATGLLGLSACVWRKRE